MSKELIFVVDPMCSWCWGFAPVLESLRASTEYKCSLVVGGLRSQGQMAWDSSSKDYLKGHWKQVAKSTGQPFSDDLFEKEDFDYDTYPSCKAIITVRELFGLSKAFEYLHILQEAFYVQSQNITQVGVIVDLLETLDIDKEAFKTFYESQRAQVLMEHDFSKARSMGANAFPSVVVIDADGHMHCQKGYRSLKEMKNLLGEYDA
jgi:putative protein-disulfide isomerase